MNFQSDNPFIFGFPIGTLWGARVRVSPFYPLILLWLLPLGFKVGLLAFAVLTITILLHEYAHVFAARLTGGDADEVVLWPLGGLALCRRAPTFQSEFLTPAAGPLFNLAACAVLLTWVPTIQFHAAIHPLDFPSIDGIDGFFPQLAVLAFALNWKLFLFNLLPMLPLDGASMCHAVARARWTPIVAKSSMLIASTLTHLALAIIALNIHPTMGIHLLLFTYMLLPVTILEWIRLQAREVFGQQGIFLCDFFHVSEYWGAAAASCRAQAPDRWRRTQQDRLKRGALGKVMEALAEHLEPAGTPEENAPVRNGHRYLTNRTDCLDYPRALKLGLPIGSGMIESGHRQVLQARLKKAGTAWLVEHADQIANLRVLRANRQWLSLWN